MPRVMREGSVAWRVVGRIRAGGMNDEGRRRRHGRVLRGCSVEGVIISL